MRATDYNFETPSIDLSASATGIDSRGRTRSTTTPACATKRDRPSARALRQQEVDARAWSFRGTSYAPGLTPGFKFSLRASAKAAETFDGSYVVTSVRHHARES